MARAVPASPRWPISSELSRTIEPGLPGMAERDHDDEPRITSRFSLSRRRIWHAANDFEKDPTRWFD